MGKNRARAMIIVFLFSIIGSITIIGLSAKLVWTCAKLAIINDNIQFYNEAERKTDEMTMEAEELFEFREKEFYNSEDFLVRTFSNLNPLFKILVIMGDIVILLYLLDMWFFFGRNIIASTKRKRRKKQKK